MSPAQGRRETCMKNYEGKEAVYLLDIETDLDPDQEAERLLAYLVVFKDPSDVNGHRKEEEART